MADEADATDKSCLHAILVHGADRLAFGEDVMEAKQRGIQVHAVELPVYSGHPIDDMHDYFDRACAEIQAVVAGIRDDDPGGRVAGIGRNLGGSILGYQAARTSDFDLLVFTGAIPDLSRFKASSARDGARRYRDMLGGEDRADRFLSLSELDLTATLLAIPASICLVQVGLVDPWMDDVSFETFRAFESAGYHVTYHDDDHAMIGPPTLAERWQFIQSRGYA